MELAQFEFICEEFKLEKNGRTESKKKRGKKRKNPQELEMTLFMLSPAALLLISCSASVVG